MLSFRNIIAASAVCAAGLSASAAPLSEEVETARITTLVASIPMAVDFGAFDLAESAFAETVEMDYTSLWGGTPLTITAAEVIAGWKGIVPGFDATFHEINDVSVSLAGVTATATAQVDGRHWIGDAVWRPIGTYHWDLELQNGDWQVTRMVFDLSDERGSRDLVAQAMERAAQTTK